RRIKVKVLGAGQDNRSSPEQTLLRAEAHLSDLQPEPGDQVWLVLDTDRWTEKQLMTVSRACADRNWGLTISNPCFEIWLYLHYSDLPTDYAGSGQQLK
ncbi:MAG: RloB family protein, partial [Bacteroidota bacterium]